MDSAVAAVRLPPVARAVGIALCTLACTLAAVPPAGARALTPPPLRLAVVWGRPSWSPLGPVALAPPPGRWEAAWAAGGPLTLPIPPRSLHGRA
ncbi:MAG: hypothetical protein MUE66_08050 [Acidimicrobiia bacterium]|nr:hypothetical protein [Acidimicrobiia bacterium]